MHKGVYLQMKLLTFQVSCLNFFVIYLKNFEDLQDVSFQRIQHAVRDLVLVGLERETSCSFSAPFRLDRAFAQNQSAPYCKDSIKFLV